MRVAGGHAIGERRRFSALAAALFSEWTGIDSFSGDSSRKFVVCRVWQQFLFDGRVLTTSAGSTPVDDFEGPL